MAIKSIQDKENAIFNIMNDIKETASEVESHSTNVDDRIQQIDMHVSAVEAKRLLAYKPTPVEGIDYDLKIFDIDHTVSKEKVSLAQRV